MANIGDKFIIELAVECPNSNNDRYFILKNTKGMQVMVKESTLDGFEKWDEQSVIKQLEEFSKGVSDDIEAAYQRGLNEAWKAAGKIINPPIDGGLAVRDLTNIFGIDYDDPKKVLKDFRGESAVKRIATYEAKKKAEEEEIKVGDEVSTKMIRRGIVTRVNNCEGGAWCYVMESGGNSCSAPIRNLRKTGKHFPQVAELLAAMEEDGDTNE